MNHSTLTLGLAAALGALAVAAPAEAQIIAPPPAPAPVAAAAPTIALAPCTIVKSRNHGGFTYASCTITADNLPAQGDVSVQYRSNLSTFNPGTLGPWRRSSGTLGFDGSQGSNEILSIKFAFKGRTVAQVRKALKVTLSQATGGATIVAPTGA